MVREIIAGFPCEIEKKGGVVIMKFLPKSPTAKYPDNPVLILKLDKNERKKLIDMLG